MVAQRAGVSVGTLYQYFPNKQALLFAVLERDLLLVVEAIEKACAASHFESIETMVDELVNRFIDAKVADRESVVALFRIAAQVGGSLLIEGFHNRCQGAAAAMLQMANLPRSADVSFMAEMIFLTMAGTLRGHIEGNAPARLTVKLRQHLAKLIMAYCKAM